MDEPLSRNTIEFRQHAGSMDADTIENWIRVAAGLVDFCVHASFDDVVRPVLRRLEQRDPHSQQSYTMNRSRHTRLKINVTHWLHALDGPDYSVYDFLWDINLGVQAEWYRKRGLHPMPSDSPCIGVKAAKRDTGGPYSSTSPTSSPPGTIKLDSPTSSETSEDELTHKIRQ